MGQSKRRATPEELKEARRAADFIEEEAAALLYSFLRNEIYAEDLATASRDDETTLSKMSTRSGGVLQRLKTFISASKLSSEVRRQFLDLVNGELGAEWSDARKAAPAEGRPWRKAQSLIHEVSLLTAEISESAAFSGGPFDSPLRKRLRDRLSLVRQCAADLEREFDALDGREPAARDRRPPVQEVRR